MAAASDREEVALSSSELDDVLNSAGLTEGESKAPEDDLELYGVWVKVKPQPLARARKSAPPSELADLESVETAELTEDEQNLLAQLETEPPQGPPALEAELAQDLDLAPLDVDLVAEAETDGEIPSLLGVEELTIEDGTTEAAPPAFGELSLEDSETPSLDDDIASLDAELAAMDASSSEEEGIPVALDDATADDELPSLEGDLSLELPAAEEPSDDGLPALDVEMSLDELSGSDDGLPSLGEDLVLEEPGADEPLSGSDDLMLEQPSVGEELVLDGPDLTELALEEEEPVPAPSRGNAGIQELEAAEAHEQETPTLGGEDGMPGLDLETEALASPAPAAQAEPDSRKPDAAALILEKIEQELHAIRREISDLKGELTVLRAGREEVTGPQALEGEEAAAGFFAGEEDETIALTGDELDNILNTADVTEGKESSPDLAGALDAVLPLQEEQESSPVEGIDDILDEDILEQATEEQDAQTETVELEVVTDLDALRIPEEDLIDASGDDGITDESSLLPAEPLEALDLGEEEPQAAADLAEEDLSVEMFPEVDLGPSLAEEPALPEDLAADLAADAEAAMAEHREAEAAAPSIGDIPEVDLLLESEPDSAELLGVELDMDEPLPSLETEEVLEPGEEFEAAPLLEIDLGETEDLASEPEMPAIEVEEPALEEATEELLVEDEEPTTVAKAVPEDLRDEIKSVLAYLDQLLEALPDEKIEEFAKSEYFGVYKKLFVELGLEE